MSDKGLPSSVSSERLLLGLVLLNYRQHWRVIEGAPPDLFSLEAHRRIFSHMRALADEGQAIDGITLAEALTRSGQLANVGGLTALTELTDGVPEVPNAEAYLKILYEKYTLRRLLMAATSIADRVMIGVESPAAIALAMEESARELQIAQGTASGGLTPSEIVANYPGGVGAFLDPTQRVRGLQTGFTKLDEMTGGLRGGEYIIVAARPSVGKTSFAMNVAYNIAKDSDLDAYERLARGSTEDLSTINGVSVFSLEMSASSLLERMLCSEARVDQQRFRLGYLNRDERLSLQHMLGKLAEVPLFIDDSAGISLDRIAQQLRRDVKRRGVKVAIIDYIGLMSAKAENRQNEVSKISRGLKLLAKDLNITVVALSQLNRAVETRAGGSFVPQLSDLRDSGSIEQDADVVMFLYREELYKRDREDLKGLAEVIVGKQRNGPIGKVPLRFFGRFTRFENRAEEQIP